MNVSITLEIVIGDMLVKEAVHAAGYQYNPERMIGGYESKAVEPRDTTIRQLLVQMPSRSLLAALAKFERS